MTDDTLSNLFHAQAKLILSKHNVQGAEWSPDSDPDNCWLFIPKSHADGFDIIVSVSRSTINFSTPGVSWCAYDSEQKNILKRASEMLSDMLSGKVFVSVRTTRGYWTYTELMKIVAGIPELIRGVGIPSHHTNGCSKNLFMNNYVEHFSPVQPLAH